MFRRLPLTIRLPLVVAAMIFAAAIGTTQLVIQSVSRNDEQQIERLGHVYLDGLSAALLAALRDGDEAGVERALRAALSVHDGMLDRRLLFLGGDGALVAHSERPGLAPSELPPGLGEGERGLRIDFEDASVWVWRELEDPLAESHGGVDRRLGTVVANLDVRPLLEERASLHSSLLGLDVLVSGLCALLGFAFARRVQKPLTLLAQHVESSVGRTPRPVSEGQIPRDNPEVRRLIEAFNTMAEGARDREAMLAHMEEQEREAVLGRMAATLAHEVRNPLAGMLTAIRTLRRFGDRSDARAEALDFVERGVLNLQDVVDATLTMHRARGPSRPLSSRDLEDVCLLVEAEARGRGVDVELDVELPPELPVAATAVRQILLNLLLNAVQASGPGGSVTLRGRRTEDELRFDVLDRGHGLSPAVAEGLARGTSPAGEGGLGVAIIVRLVERLEGRVSVDAHPERGTHITLHLPLRMESDKG